MIRIMNHESWHDAAATADGGDDDNDQVKRNAGEPFDFISKFNLPVVNALWNVTAGHRFEYNDPKLISMIQVKLRYTNDDDDADDIVETDWLVETSGGAIQRSHSCFSLDFQVGWSDNNADDMWTMKWWWRWA